MSLVNCPECHKQISATAKNCPHCGYVQAVTDSKKSRKKASSIPLILVAIMAVFLIVYYEIERSRSDKESSRIHQTESWDSGGTLHSSTIVEWKAASDRNKLATCADFMAKVDNTVSMETLKRRSQNLVNCIDEAVKGHKYADNDDVAIIAALCIKTMGYK